MTKPMEYFKKGTLKCQFCNTQLHFKNIGGMRIVDEENNYDCKCVKCNKFFKVKA